MVMVMVIIMVMVMVMVMMMMMAGVTSRTSRTLRSSNFKGNLHSYQRITLNRRI